MALAAKNTSKTSHGEVPTEIADATSTGSMRLIEVHSRKRCCCRKAACHVFQAPLCHGIIRACWLIFMQLAMEGAFV